MTSHGEKRSDRGGGAATPFCEKHFGGGWPPADGFWNRRRASRGRGDNFMGSLTEVESFTTNAAKRGRGYRKDALRGKIDEEPKKQKVHLEEGKWRRGDEPSIESTSWLGEGGTTIEISWDKARILLRKEANTESRRWRVRHGLIKRKGVQIRRTERAGPLRPLWVRNQIRGRR